MIGCMSNRSIVRLAMVRYLNLNELIVSLHDSVIGCLMGSTVLLILYFLRDLLSYAVNCDLVGWLWVILWLSCRSNDWLTTF